MNFTLFSVARKSDSNEVESEGEISLFFLRGIIPVSSISLVNVVWIRLTAAEVICEGTKSHFSNLIL